MLRTPLCSIFKAALRKFLPLLPLPTLVRTYLGPADPPRRGRAASASGRQAGGGGPRGAVVLGGEPRCRLPLLTPQAPVSCPAPSFRLPAGTCASAPVPAHGDPPWPSRARRPPSPPPPPPHPPDHTYTHPHTHANLSPGQANLICPVLDVEAALKERFLTTRSTLERLQVSAGPLLPAGTEREGPMLPWAWRARPHAGQAGPPVQRPAMSACVVTWHPCCCQASIATALLCLRLLFTAPPPHPTTTSTPRAD